jgi:hypothetical protein
MRQPQTAKVNEAINERLDLPGQSWSPLLHLTKKFFL